MKEEREVEHNFCLIFLYNIYILERWSGNQKWNTVFNMKSAKISRVLIEPTLHQEMVQSSELNEGLVDGGESTVRTEVKRRPLQTEFLQRGSASIRNCIVSGRGIPASSVIAKIEVKLKAAKQLKSNQIRGGSGPSTADNL